MASNAYMKRNIVLSVIAAGLTLLPVASTKAFETAQGVVATPITTVPFVIATSGNYYLPANLTFTAAAGAAITITASEVVLDLNGRTLSSGIPTAFTVGVLVFNSLDVTVQNGDIDNFGYAGVYLAPNSTDVNAKNTVDNIKFNNNLIGVLSISGTSNWVKNCVIDGGDVGIMFQADNGSRASNNILQLQTAHELLGMGVGLVSMGSGGVYFENNEVLKGSNPVGQFMSGTDKFRFETFVGFSTLGPHTGGTDETFNSL
jgi:hypothetical protein